MNGKSNVAGFLVVAALLALGIALFAGGFFTPDPNAPAPSTSAPPAAQPAP